MKQNSSKAWSLIRKFSNEKRPEHHFKNITVDKITQQILVSRKVKRIKGNKKNHMKNSTRKQFPKRLFHNRRAYLCDKKN